MSAETIALDAAALAATNQTVAANNLKDAIELLETGYAATKTTVDTELNNVDNTSDADKPVSTAAQTLSNTKQVTLVSGTNIATINGQSLLSNAALVIARGAVEVPMLAYEDRADLRTPAAPIPTTGDVVNMPDLGEFQFRSELKYVDDDEMVFQAVSPADGVTPVGQWVQSTPAFEWLEIQKMFEVSILQEFMEDEQIRFLTY